jgi:hypothetical protein
MEKKRILGISLTISGFGFILYLINKYWSELFPKQNTIVTGSSQGSVNDMQPIINLQIASSQSGEYTLSGNGIALYFDIPHTFGVIPTSAVVTAASEDAQGFSHIQKTATYIRIFYAIAPPEVANNLVFNYNFIK